MKKYCPKCRFANFAAAVECRRCRFDIVEVSAGAGRGPGGLAARIVKRGLIVLFVCGLGLLGFYLSLIGSSKPLTYDEKKTVKTAIAVLEARGFTGDAFLLRRLTAFRGNDNWLNASTRFEKAYAATNFPVEIVTVYPDFFTVTGDDIERAAVLLHEAQHLKGADEKEAYEFVWKNRRQLGWTRETHGASVMWKNVRRQTKENVPALFVCEHNAYGDCTEQ